MNRIQEIIDNAIKTKQISAINIMSPDEHNKLLKTRTYIVAIGVDIDTGKCFEFHFPESQVEEYAKNHSKLYGTGKSLWDTNFDEMAKLTILKSVMRTWLPQALAKQL